MDMTSEDKSDMTEDVTMGKLHFHISQAKLVKCCNGMIQIVSACQKRKFV